MCDPKKVCQITLPSSDQIDTSHSFKLENATCIGYKFKSCKAKLKRNKAKAAFDDHYAITKAKCDKMMRLVFL